MADNNTFADRLDDFQVQTIPTSQSIAQGLGATPQQTAMTGTQLQKQSTIAQRIAQSSNVDSTLAQQQELARVERLQAPRREMTVAEAMEAERQQQLAKLGNIGQRIQSTIANNVNAIQQQQTGKIEVEGSILSQMLGLAGAQVDVAKQDPSSNYVKISNALNSYLATKDPNDLEQAFATIDNLKLYGLSSADAKRLVGLTQDTMAKQTGQVVAENVMDQVTLKDIDLPSLGLDTNLTGVAELLGISEEEASNLTIDEFSDAIESQRKAEFSRIEQMKAELAAAPLGSVQRDILLRELRDMGQVGITGIEVAAAQTAKDIDLATYLKVGNEQIKVSDFLDDEQLSQMVIDWINEDDPVKKSAIIPESQFPELVAWIKSNQNALAELSDTADDTKEVYDAANNEYQSLNVIDDLNTDITSDIMSKIIPNWDPNNRVTSSEMADIKSKFNSTMIGQVIGDNTLDKSDRRDIINKVNNLSEDIADSVLNLSKDDMLIAHYAASNLQDNPDLAKFLGIQSNQGFVLDADSQYKIADYENVINTISQQHPDWLNTNTNTLNYLKTFTPEQLQKLADNPNRYNDLKLFSDKRTEFENIQTDEDKLKYLLNDESISIDELNAQYQDARKWANLGDTEAGKVYTAMQKMFGASDQITSYNIDWAINNTVDSLNVPIDDVLAGNLNKNSILQTAGEFSKIKGLTGPNGALKMYEPYINDGQLTDVDFLNMSDAQKEEIGKWADKNPGIRVNLGGFNTYEEYDANLKETEFLDTADNLAANVGFDSLLAYEDWKDALSKDAMPTSSNVDQLRRFATLMESARLTAKTDKQRSLYDELVKDINATLATTENMITAAKNDLEEADRLRKQYEALRAWGEGM